MARPILLDRVAIDFPESTLIGIHVGIPWADEMIAMAWKHEHVYIGLDAYAPKHLPASLLHYMNTYGDTKVLFGTHWPVIDPRRGVREMQAHALRPRSRQLIARDNAIRIFPKMASRLSLKSSALRTD